MGEEKKREKLAEHDLKELGTSIREMKERASTRMFYEQRIAGAHGPKCAAFLKLHAAEDVDHLEKALEFLADVPAGERAFIEKNLVQSTHAYIGVLRETREDSRREGR